MNTHSLIEISLSDLDDAATPPVISLFDRWGRGGAVVEQMADEEGRCHVKTYLLPEDDDSLRQIEIGLEVLNQARRASSPHESAPARQLPQPRIRFLSEADWAEAWKTGYDVLRVGRHLVIKPTWCDYAPQAGDLIIELDPGMAFGSGLHATTRLCLEALEDYLSPQVAALDVGTGSGILAIAAARLGASQVLAMDTDSLAVRVARENVALNGVGSTVHVETGTVQIPDSKLANRQSSKAANWQSSKAANWQSSKATKRQTDKPTNRQTDKPTKRQTDISRGWDLVVANILAETIIELMPALAANLATEGTLIASGIIADRAEAVIASLHENRLSLIERRDDGEWAALIACKQTKDE